MEKLETDNILQDSNNIFDDYFDTTNLNDELRRFYDFLNDEELNESFETESKLTNIRNENYRRYSDINLLCLDNLSIDFENISKEIKKIYSFIDSEELLKDDIETAIDNKKIIDLVYYYLDKLEKMVEDELKLLDHQNDIRQKKVKEIDYSQIDEKTLREILIKYNNIVLFNSTLEETVFDNYSKQIKRKEYLNELYKLINLELSNVNQESSEKKDLNNEIEIEIRNINDRIAYLEDLMIEKSKYETEFKVFKNYFSNLIAYDDSDYTDLSRVHYNICEDLKIKSLLNYFEDSFIKERENILKEEKFIYEKFGIKNLNASLDYISANYMDLLDGIEKETINNIYKLINDGNYELSNLYSQLKNIVNTIWDKSITNVYSYKQNEPFCFICSNNQFIDERYQTILITNKMLDRVEDYSDYQIGFICNYSNNILYVTENNDIMTVNHNDMSNLKTPKQIEQEFVNFKVCNRIALNGFLTKVEAVYYINDKNSNNKIKAIELANMYCLPLIELKKD